MLGVWKITGLMYCNIIAILDQGLDKDLVFNLQLDSFVSSRSNPCYMVVDEEKTQNTYQARIFVFDFCLLPHTVWLFTVYHGLECE